MGGEILGTVKFYGQPNYGDLVLELNNLDANSNEPAGNINSFDIPSGWSIVIYDQDSHNGDSRCFNASYHNLQDHELWNQRIESVAVFTDDVCEIDSSTPFWDAHYYSGDSKWWDRDIPQSTATCNYRIDGEILAKDYGTDSPCGGGS